MIDIEALLRADRRALGQAITLLESSRSDHREHAESMLNQLMPHTGNSMRIGITGVPGVGKSTFIDVFGKHVIACGHKVAVLTIDPSSSVSGGSILGDKTRMAALATDPNAYIRPSPAGSTLGGVARRTREAILLCEAAGFDIVIVETVGVGQSETLVSEMTDIFLLLLLPGAGDDLQGIKRGIMELADIAIVNKADGDLVRAAGTAAADIHHALQLLKPRQARWKVPVLSVSALQDEGISEVWQAVESYRKITEQNEQISIRRSEQAVSWLWRETGEYLLQYLRQDSVTADIYKHLQQQVRDGTIAPSVAARNLADSFIKPRENIAKK